MRLAGCALPLLAAAQLVLGNEFLDRKNKYEQLRLNAQTPSAQDEDLSVAAPKFLNKKTKKFQVDGSKLPFIDFNIGESYSGLLPVDDTGKELFFWFFPSSTGAGAKDITIWLNGGPGCSSLAGLFEENGPMVFRPGTYGPIKNPYAYNKLANTVWIEQPVGTGYTSGTANATNEVEVADQFNAFWKNFVNLFDLHDFGVYITGESYAGQYVPYIGDGMLSKNDTTFYDLKGIIIYDPVIGPFTLIEPVAVPFAQKNAGSFPFAPDAWASLLEKQESCGYAKFVEENLQFPPKGHFKPPHITKECDLYDQILNELFAINPCLNIYHISETCPTEGDILGGPNGPGGPSIKSLATPYFNRDDVKRILHAPVDKTWNECSGGVLDHDTSPGSATKNGPVKRIAEATNNVIVGHATQDAILLSNATLLTLNNLVWNGAQGFEKGPTTPFFVPHNLGTKKIKYNYLGAWTKSRGLTFVEVNLSGHMIPQYQPGAAFRHLEVLLGRVPSLSSKVPFTV